MGFEPFLKKAARRAAIGVGASAMVFIAPPLLGLATFSAVTGFALGSLMTASMSATVTQSIGATATVVPAVVADHTTITTVPDVDNQPAPGCGGASGSGGTGDTGDTNSSSGQRLQSHSASRNTSSNIPKNQGKLEEDDESDSEQDDERSNDGEKNMVEQPRRARGDRN
ncbi:hypothetical protein FRC09_007986 [Ceratobasidium sp. 395]|nr:hypothetical protein FRC09_007986 [Ceratobasidium sp. 395]